MLLSQLEARIAEYHEAFGDDADPVIQVAVQPGYPMTAPFKGVALGIELQEEEEDPSPPEALVTDAFWLTIGNNDGYGVPDNIFDIAH